MHRMYVCARAESKYGAGGRCDMRRGEAAIERASGTAQGRASDLIEIGGQVESTGRRAQGKLEGTE